MTSKILEAIQQIEHSIERLEDGKVLVDKVIAEKRQQIKDLQIQYYNIYSVEDEIDERR